MTSAKPKYQVLVEALATDILSGRAKAGDKLPSESALVRKFSVSRITVGRALKELQQRGLIDRIAGSGTYVRNAEANEKRPMLFGLLIPDLGETEIFEPICRGIANSPLADQHALLWGHTDATLASKEEQAWLLCQQYIAKRVAGVFFAPLEYERHAEKTNRQIVSALADAEIAVVLLDRRLGMEAERRRPDLVGINNRQAGFAATEHLVHLGCTRIGFLGYHGAASTISARMAGYEDALQHYGLRPGVGAVVQMESDGWDRPDDLPSALKPRRVEGFVCVNDRVAGQLMHSFIAQGVHVPEDVRVVGIDDDTYASLLPVPLTTVRQPCQAIGEAALATMLERIERPGMPARDVLLEGELVVRRSCGAWMKR